MRSIVNILVGQVGGDNLTRVGINADCEVCARRAALSFHALSNSHSPAPRTFRPVLSMIRWSGSEVARGFCKTFNPPALRLRVVLIGNGRSISSNFKIEPINLRLTQSQAKHQPQKLPGSIDRSRRVTGFAWTSPRRNLSLRSASRIRAAVPHRATEPRLNLCKD